MLPIHGFFLQFHVDGKSLVKIYQELGYECLPAEYLPDDYDGPTVGTTQDIVGKDIQVTLYTVIVCGGKDIQVTLYTVIVCGVTFTNVIYMCPVCLYYQVYRVVFGFSHCYGHLVLCQNNVKCLLAIVSFLIL